MTLHKDESQRVKVDVTPPSPVGSISVGISPNVTSGGDHVVMIDTEHIELFAAKETKMNSQKWVKKHESQISEINQLKLKTVLHNDRDEIHMTQSVGFVVADSISVGRARWSSFE